MNRLARLGLFALWTGTASGQMVVSARAGLVSHLEGTAYRDSQRIEGITQLGEGQTLRTERGRVELLLGPGAVLWLGEHASLRMENTRLADAKVVLEQGSALIEVTELIRDARLRIYFRDNVIEFPQSGLSRWDATPGSLRVYGGEAAVTHNDRTIRVKRGQAVALAGSLTISKFDLKPADALHRWAGRRSFELINLPEVIWTQKHWQPTNAGHLRNKNFGMEFPSAAAALRLYYLNKDHQQSLDEAKRTQEQTLKGAQRQREEEIRRQQRQK